MFFSLEFRGTLYRVRNVSLGYDLGDISNLFTDTYIILHQTFSEIYLDNGFQRIVNLDRESLYEGSEVYRFLMSYLQAVINPKKGRIQTQSNLTEKDNKEIIFKESNNKVIQEAISKSGVSDIIHQIKKERAGRRNTNIKQKGKDFSKEILSLDENVEVKRKDNERV